jgi:hypothetical protein
VTPHLLRFCFIWYTVKYPGPVQVTVGEPDSNPGQVLSSGTLISAKIFIPQFTKIDILSLSFHLTSTISFFQWATDHLYFVNFLKSSRFALDIRFNNFLASSTLTTYCLTHFSPCTGLLRIIWEITPNPRVFKQHHKILHPQEERPPCLFHNQSVSDLSFKSRQHIVLKPHVLTLEAFPLVKTQCCLLFVSRTCCCCECQGSLLYFKN